MKNKIETEKIETDKKEEEKKEKKDRNLIQNFVGKDVNIMLRNKKPLKGRLESTSQYELLVTVSYNPVLIMKHAVDYIELVEGK